MKDGLAAAMGTGAAAEKAPHNLNVIAQDGISQSRRLPSVSDAEQHAHGDQSRNRACAEAR
jgi:hypothetical protein